MSKQKRKSTLPTSPQKKPGPASRVSAKFSKWTMHLVLPESFSSGEPLCVASSQPSTTLGLRFLISILSLLCKSLGAIALGQSDFPPHWQIFLLIRGAFRLRAAFVPPMPPPLLHPTQPHPPSLLAPLLLLLLWLLLLLLLWFLLRNPWAIYPFKPPFPGLLVW